MAGLANPDSKQARLMLSGCVAQCIQLAAVGYAAFGFNHTWAVLVGRGIGFLSREVSKGSDKDGTEPEGEELTYT